MGVKDLWTLLQPYSERKPLYELQNKTVAIDLAGWVCEAMCVLNYEVQPRFYLRNLFFRTSFLLLSGVTPVYVLEGTAPALKQGVICKRLDAGTFGGARPRPVMRHQGRDGYTNNPKKAARGRSSFNLILKQCEELLSCLGVTCVQGPGEAEAFCSYLNKAALVDGVISQDSDCFAYGARRVYRNFSVASQGKTAAQGGAVDVYDMDKIEPALGLGQQKLIAMALLCGCDYCPEGVPSVGRENALKFFSLFADHEILDRMRSWRTTPDAKFDLRRHDRVLCTSCGHVGSQHWSHGCTECNTTKQCNDTEWEAERLFVNNKAIKCEMAIRRKAIIDPDFPSQAIIDEFLEMPAELPPLDLRWKQPNIVKFVRIMYESVQWNEAYGLSKIMPLLTRWQLFHLGEVEDSDAEEDSGDSAAGEANLLAARRETLSNLRGSVLPECIKRKRTPKGIASYEIVWKDATGSLEGLVSDMQVQNFLSEHRLHDPLAPWSTIEPVDLVERAYPELIERFHTQIQAKKKPVSRRVASVASLEVAQSSLPLRKRRPVKPVKPNSTNAIAIPPVDPQRANSKATVKTPVLIDRFLQRMQSRYVKKSTRKAAFANGTVPRSPVRPANALLRGSFLSPRIPTSIQPMNLSQFSFGAEDSMQWTKDNMNGSSNDVSDVISAMIGEQAQQKPQMVSFCGRRLRFEQVLDTSDVCFMTIEPEQMNVMDEMEVKSVESLTDMAMEVSNDAADIDYPHISDTIRPLKTPKPLHGRPVPKIDYKTSFDCVQSGENVNMVQIDEHFDAEELTPLDPWQPGEALEEFIYERLAEDRMLTDERTSVELANNEESTDEFDRLVLAGHNNDSDKGAFVKLSRSNYQYIGAWNRIDFEETTIPIDTSSSPYSDDSESGSELVLCICGDVTAFLCTICRRVDPYNLHQCIVPVLYEGNTALEPPPGSPTCERAMQALTEAETATQCAEYEWGSIYLGHQRMHLTPSKRFRLFVDSWRHFYDHERLPDQPVHRLRHPPDMAMHEFLDDLDAKRLTSSTSTPHSDRRSSRHHHHYHNHKHRTSGPAMTPFAGVGACGVSHNVSYFFEVANEADLDWPPEDFVDNGTVNRRDYFERSIDLWQEPDLFKPSDADLVVSLYNTDANGQMNGATMPSSAGSVHETIANFSAATAAIEERRQAAAQLRLRYGEMRRDNCDHEVRLVTRGKVMHLPPPRLPSNGSIDRARGPPELDGVPMVGAMTPSVLAAERPDISFRAVPTTVKRLFNGNDGNGGIGAGGAASALNSVSIPQAGGSKENVGPQTNSQADSAAIASTSAISVVTVNDSFELNGSYVPVSKKLRNRMDLF